MSSSTTQCPSNISTDPDVIVTTSIDEEGEEE